MPGQQEVSLVLIPAPQATNPNLAAQAGTFTLDKKPEIRPLDEVVAAADLSHLRSDRIEPHAETPLLYKIEFPGSIAMQLLRLLNYEGINGATIYPGYDGVVRKMREHRLDPQGPLEVGRAEEVAGQVRGVDALAQRRGGLIVLLLAFHQARKPHALHHDVLCTGP